MFPSCYYSCSSTTAHIDHIICSVCDYYREIIRTEPSQAVLEHIVARRTDQRKSTDIYVSSEVLILNMWGEGRSLSSNTSRCFTQFVLACPNLIWLSFLDAITDYNEWTETMRFWTYNSLPKYHAPFSQKFLKE